MELPELMVATAGIGEDLNTIQTHGNVRTEGEREEGQRQRKRGGEGGKGEEEERV